MFVHAVALMKRTAQLPEGAAKQLRD